jgi:hypothetical protein
MTNPKPTESQAQLIRYFATGQKGTARITKATYYVTEERGWIERTNTWPYHRPTLLGLHVIGL